MFKFLVFLFAASICCMAYAGDGFIVKLRCACFTEQAMAENSNIICIQDQCYIVVDNEEAALLLVKTGVASGYEPNVIRRPLANPADENDGDKAKEKPEKIFEESECAY